MNETPKSIKAQESKIDALEDHSGNISSWAMGFRDNEKEMNPESLADIEKSAQEILKIVARLRDPLAFSLARKFASIVIGWIGEENMKEVLQRNRKEHNLSICHSHDFCDANQAMIDALEAFEIEFDVESDGQTALIDAAWTLAKANGFWFKR